MRQRTYFYTIQQAAQLLDISTEKVHGLLRKGKLKACRDEETGRWLIDVCSVHKCLEAFQTDLQGAGVITTVVVADAPQAKRRPFDFNLLILLIIGGVTLLAALYTLAPLLLL